MSTTVDPGNLQRVIRAIADQESETKARAMIETAMDQAITLRWFTKEATPMLCEHINVAIEHAVAPLRARIAELEARPQLRYCGVWRPEIEYVSGNFTTWDGSMWHAQTASTGSKPGADASWKLAVKRGHDANPRDLRASGFAKERP